MSLTVETSPSITLEERNRNADRIRRTDQIKKPEYEDAGLFPGNPDAGFKTVDGQSVDRVEELFQGNFGIEQAVEMTEILIARIGGISVDQDSTYAHLVNNDAKNEEIRRVDLRRVKHAEGLGSANVTVTIVNGEGTSAGAFVHELAIGSSVDGRRFTTPHVITSEIAVSQIANPFTGKQLQLRNRHRLIGITPYAELPIEGQDGSFSPSLSREGKTLFQTINRMQTSGQYLTNAAQIIR